MELRNSSTFSSTSALDVGEWLMSHPTALLPGKETRYSSYRRVGRPQDRSGRVRKISPLPGFDPLTVQPVVGRYTDGAIPIDGSEWIGLQKCGSALLIQFIAV